MLIRDTDLDVLTNIMTAQQQVVHAKRLVDDAKAQLKKAEAELGKAFDRVIPHVQSRRDELSMPSLDFLNKPEGDNPDIPNN